MTSRETPQRSEDRRGTITRMLRDWKDDPSALESLIPLVYDEMREIARGYMRHERQDHTFQATGLVNELYGHLKALDPGKTPVSRKHLLTLAAKIMRQILIDYSRAHRAKKRGGGEKEVLEEDGVLVLPANLDLLALNLALQEMEEKEPRWCQIVELRFFGGFTIEETAKILEISESTVKSDWRLAKNWLRARISSREASDG